VKDVRAETPRLGRSLGAAEERDREPALGVGERDIDGVAAPPSLDEPSFGLLQLVVAQLELDGPDDGDRYDRDPG
jgi:hypothetical protein